MKVIILAGGTGTRLWPLSTDSIPKQFLRVNGNQSLIQETYNRAMGLVDSPADIYISTNEQLKQMTLDHFGGMITESNIITEPAKKNTGPAMALVTSYLQDHGVRVDEPLLFVAADHDIRPVSEFHRYMQMAARKMQTDHIVVFGITPTRPETGYGYIHVLDKDIETMIQPVHEFVEKPDRSTAQQYISQGGYYRNSGIFMTTLTALTQEFSLYSPQLSAHIQSGYDVFVQHYDSVEQLPFDKAIMEHTHNAVVVPMSLQWSDVGSWDSIYDIGEHDVDENVAMGDVTTHNVRGSYIRSTNTPIKINDVDDIIVVECEDGIYITRKGSSQDIKKVL